MNKAVIDVRISHFVVGQGISYTEDYGSCWMYEKDLQDPAEVNKAIDAYCETLAENTVRYDANKQDYIVELWHKGKRIGRAVLSDYLDFMTNQLGLFSVKLSFQLGCRSWLRVAAVVFGLAVIFGLVVVLGLSVCYG